ncbi:MAG: sugar phosphate nucleotidyltransferase [Candidatus Woesebacteria bacterium]
MQALILAAGFGTRLKEFGETLPKGLIPTGNSTLLGKVMSELQNIPVTLITNAKFYPQYAEWIDKESKALVLVNDKATDPDNRLGALGDLLFALESTIGWNDDLLVIPSDTYYEFSIQDFIAFAQAKNSFATVVRKMDTTLIAGRLGCAVVEGEYITSFVEKPQIPPSDLAAIPFYYYPKAVLARLPEYKQEGGNMDAPGSIIPWFLSKQIPVVAYLTQGQTLDVGTMSDVERLQTL